MARGSATDRSGSRTPARRESCEFVGSSVEGDLERYYFNGYYLSGSWFLTGEERPKSFVRFRLPWEDEVIHVDGTSCGFGPPTRLHAPDNLLPEPLPGARKAA